MDFQVPKELMYFSLYLTCKINQDSKRMPCIEFYNNGIVKLTDLTDIISDSLGTENIKGIFVCMVVSLGQLKCLLIAQLQIK